VPFSRGSPCRNSLPSPAVCGIICACGCIIESANKKTESELEDETNEMSSWNDPDRWAALCSGTACPICCRREPLDVVAKLEVCWVTMQEAAPVPGYSCLVSQSHVVELHDLPDADASAFMRDAQRVSRALTAATGAVKLNYEIHGNSLPHLHMHFFPRYRGDQFEGQPINPRLVAQPVYGPGEFQRIRDAFLLALNSSAA
jgi:diadenosine tetraphosphate (Ap4A) HIT family hydrolase